jgi:hypothetical protein
MLAATTAATLSFGVQTGHWYAIVDVTAGGGLPAVHVTGSPATAAKTYGTAHLGL